MSMGAISSIFFGPGKGDVGHLKEKYGQSPSQFIELSNGNRIHFRDEGDSKAPTIVLVHGHSEDLHTWHQFVEHLAVNFRVIRFDLRRHGLTGPSMDNEYGIDHYVSDLSDLIELLGVSSVFLIGHSMGGRISIKYTLANQDRVKGLVLISASGAPRDQKGSRPLALRMMGSRIGRFLIKRIWSRNMARRSLEDMVFDKSSISDKEVDRMWDLSRYPGNMDAMFREFTDSWADFNPAEVRAISTDTLLIWGEEDTVCPLSMGVWYDSLIPNATLVRLPKVGHNPQFECPGECLEEISSWMAR